MKPTLNQLLIENVHINHLKHLQFFADDTAVVSEGKAWQNGFKAGWKLWTCNS